MDTGITTEAVALLQQTLVWDNHACMPLRPGDDAFLDQLNRAHAAGLDAVTLNVGFGPQPLDDHLRMLASFRRWFAERADKYALARSVSDIDAAKAQRRLAVLFDVEGMAPLDTGDFGLVAMLRELGVGWMLVAYNRNNAAGGGCMDEDPGLTTHGRAILAEMKRVGMIVCCSHTGHRTAHQVIEAADNPVIFSHSNASALHPHVRNIPDELIRACAATDGVVGVNGVGDFLGEGTDYAELIVRHIDHIVQLVGPDHVGISLDYVFDQQEVLDYLDKMKSTFGAMAEEFTCRFAPPETFIGITAALLERGYAADDIAKVLGGNWRRVAARVWRD